ncbi:phosphatidylinositol glycan class c [Holotrichia oblita]|uniref:Phosphatidylinositol glycan class c n=1 Tax=Holotrichia oblita TaxID=644536 RepID=A0ACB9TRP1_HOLOL|nr:phosphatidylinositol glycan class c [Holotrichia oblita]
MPEPKSWKKILYEDQGYPDDYTDKTFLKDLRKNVKVEEISLTEAILGATCLIQELCTVVFLTLVYVHLYNDWIHPDVVMISSNVLVVLGFLLYNKTINLAKGMMNHIRTFIIFYIFARFFSPVLYTLTDTISTDTIYATTFLMMVIHLIFFDYGLSAAIVSNSLSLSAAIFASICLASRLASSYHALSLITVAISCFLLFPVLRNKYPKSIIITILLILSVLYILFKVSKVMTAVFVITLIFIGLVCPVLFIRYQSYKQNIYGPWDEAIIDNAVHINDLIYS